MLISGSQCKCAESRIGVSPGDRNADLRAKSLVERAATKTFGCAQKFTFLQKPEAFISKPKSTLDFSPLPSTKAAIKHTGPAPSSRLHFCQAMNSETGCVTNAIKNLEIEMILIEGS